jgi:hypothetical protein
MQSFSSSEQCSIPSHHCSSRMHTLLVGQILKPWAHGLQMHLQSLVCSFWYSGFSQCWHANAWHWGTPPFLQMQSLQSLSKKRLPTAYVKSSITQGHSSLATQVVPFQKSPTEQVVHPDLDTLGQTEQSDGEGDVGARVDTSSPGHFSSHLYSFPWHSHFSHALSSNKLFGCSVCKKWNIYFTQRYQFCTLTMLPLFDAHVQSDASTHRSADRHLSPSLAQSNPSLPQPEKYTAVLILKRGICLSFITWWALSWIGAKTFGIKSLFHRVAKCTAVVQTIPPLVTVRAG